MSNPDRLYQLLPSIYRQRDLAQGSPLRELLQVIAEQVDVVEADIDQLYENWFIETCQDWVVPYIAELISYRVATGAGAPGDSATAQGLALNRVLFPRREVANTVRYRRRKGTLALLELLANDVAQWPARAVEFYTLLGWTQHLNHLNPSRGRTVDLRDADLLMQINSPFDRVAHTVEIANLQARRDPGRYHLPNVGVFIWRLKPYSVTQTPAYCLEEAGPHCYTFSVLGNDTPLFTRPEPETDPTHIAEPLNLPVPISRFAFTAPRADSSAREQASTLYYGRDRSLAIWADGWGNTPVGEPIPANRIIPADLDRWHYRPPPNYIAVDPERGRIIFPSSQPPRRRRVRVYYHYGFSHDVGGGEYTRSLEQMAGSTVYSVGQQAGNFSNINAALSQWRQDQVDHPIPHAVIEITDSRAYTDVFDIHLGPNQSLQVRAASGVRPVIRLLDHSPDDPDSFQVSGEAGSSFTLDGLLLTGRGVCISGTMARVVVRHCTLVPGWELDSDCESRHATEASLLLFDMEGDVLIDHSIIGSIQVNRDQVQTDPIAITLTDSILDATSSKLEAIGTPGCPVAHASLRVYRSTAIGYSQVHAMPLAENSIFMGRVTVARRQTGCMRFCYVPPGSKTPRRYRCQPDLVDAAAPAEAKDQERQRVQPKFNSLRYGQPAYCQLAHLCADEIKQGADDGSEMGVFHNLFEPQRQAILQARLDEFTPADMTAGLIYAT